MLGHHRHQVLLLQGWIQGLLQVGQEGVEILPQGDPLRALQQTVDANAYVVGDRGHIRGPLGPILAIAAFFDDAGIDRAGRYLVHQVQGQLAKAVPLILLAAADYDDAVGARLVQVSELISRSKRSSWLRRARSTSHTTLKVSLLSRACSGSSSGLITTGRMM